MGDLKCVGLYIIFPFMFTIYSVNAKVIEKEIASEFTHMWIYLCWEVVHSLCKAASTHLDPTHLHYNRGGLFVDQPTARLDKALLSC